MSETDRRALEIVALRRNTNASAEQLRRDVPLLLARLAAEVSGAAIELHFATHEDGHVRAEVVIDAGPSTDELRREAAIVLQPIAEVAEVDPALTAAEWTVWPLVGDSTPSLGFRANSTSATNTIRWTASSTDPDLVTLVSAHPGSGIRLRFRADDTFESGAQSWWAEAAVLTKGPAPSFRLRAQIRCRFPGLRISHDTTAESTVLRLDDKHLPGLFAVPVGGEEPSTGICTGSAAPVPAPTTRDTAILRQSVTIGSAVTAAGKRAPVVLSGQERLRHVHVVGRTGTGKSSCLAGVINEIACSDDGLLLLDPHGHLVDRVVAELPAAAAARTWLVRCGDVNNPVPLNPLAITDPIRREIAIADICDLFQNLFDKKNTGIVGPRFRERVAMGLRALTSVFGDRASLLDVPPALASSNFMSQAVGMAKDDRLKAWLANDIKNRQSGEYADLVSWVNSKFEAFSATTALRGILGSGANAIDMPDAMDTGRIVLVDLSKSALGESATELLGFLYLNRAWTAALQRQDTAKPFTIVVDEAQAMISGALTSMLSEGRKFGISVILAHQYLGQLDEDLRPAIDGNVATTVAFRSAVNDLPALRQRFGDRIDGTTLMTLPDLAAIIMRTAGRVAADPHTLIIDHNERVTSRTGTQKTAFESAITRATVQDLVDPFREFTEPAAEGRSAVSTATAAKPIPQRLPKPTTSAPANGSGSGFLDEWLARRAKPADPVQDASQSA